MATSRKSAAGKAAGTTGSAGGRDERLPDFERSMSELDEAVRLLETGDLTLEESLAAFEKGVGLVKALQSRLDEVQARVDQLTTAADGSVQVTPLASARPRSSAAWEEDADDPEDGGDE